MNILITGAGRGLGFELVTEALERGHSVLAGVRSLGKGSRLEQLRESFGGKLSYALFDVTSEEAISEFAAKCAEQGVQIDAIVNNAAILTDREIPIEQLDITDAARSFDVNVLGAMRVVKHLLPRMSGSEGVIVNISSDAASLHGAYGGDYAYGISKTALNMFTEQLKHALKPRGIAVYSVHPGWMKTDMGGSNATDNPRESAAGIMDLIERRIVPSGRFSFMDHKGNSLEI